MQKSEPIAFLKQDYGRLNRLGQAKLGQVGRVKVDKKHNLI